MKKKGIIFLLALCLGTLGCPLGEQEASAATEPETEYEKAVEKVAGALIAHEEKVNIYDGYGEGIVALENDDNWMEFSRNVAQSVFEKDKYAQGVLGEMVEYRVQECEFFFGRKTQEIEITYPQTKEDYQKKKAELKTRTEEIVHQILSDSYVDSEFEKVLAVHDYLVTHVVYDEGKGENASVPYGAIVEHKATCNGYSLSMNLILGSMGIDCIKVASYAEKGGMGHAWNLVKVDGKWYHVDVTWDDPVPDRGNVVSYQFFLLNSNEIGHSSLGQGRHYNWEELPETQTAIFTDYSMMNRQDSTRQVYSYIDNCWYVKKTKHSADHPFGIDVLCTTEPDGSNEKDYIVNYKGNIQDITTGLSIKETEIPGVSNEVVQSQSSKPAEQKNLNNTIVIKKVTTKNSVRKMTIGVKEKIRLSYKKKKVVKWTSSNNKAVTVSSKGWIQGKKTGTSDITALLSDGSKAICKVTVKKAPGKVSVAKKKITLKAGKKAKIKVKLPNKTASFSVFYTTKDKKIATVSSDGTICGKKKGRTTITVKTFNGKKTKVQVTVK